MLQVQLVLTCTRLPSMLATRATKDTTFAVPTSCAMPSSPLFAISAAPAMAMQVRLRPLANLRRIGPELKHEGCSLLLGAACRSREQHRFEHWSACRRTLIQMRHQAARGIGAGRRVGHRQPDPVTRLEMMIHRLELELTGTSRRICGSHIHMLQRALRASVAGMFQLCGRCRQEGSERYAREIIGAVHRSRCAPAATLLSSVIVSTGSSPTKLMNPGLNAKRLQPRASVLPSP